MLVRENLNYLLQQHARNLQCIHFMQLNCTEFTLEDWQLYHKLAVAFNSHKRDWNPENFQKDLEYLKEKC